MTFLAGEQKNWDFEKKKARWMGTLGRDADNKTSAKHFLDDNKGNWNDWNRVYG